MKQKFIIGSMILFSVLFAVSTFILCRQLFDKQKSNETFGELVEILQEDVSTPNKKPEGTNTPGTAFDKYVDVYALNKDLIGWISIDGTNIDYPVMQTKEQPDYYLKRNFDKQYSDYGVPYVAENCDVDISDNTIIYGHNMKNGTMFHDLNNYISQSFYEEHKIIHFDTLGSFGEYEIIAVFKTPVYNENGFKYYQFATAANKAEFDEYVEQCLALSLYNTGKKAVYGDKLITLSTCEYSQQNGRIVVVAKKIA